MIEIIKLVNIICGILLVATFWAIEINILHLIYHEYPYYFIQILPLVSNKPTKTTCTTDFTYSKSI